MAKYEVPRLSADLVFNRPVNIDEDGISPGPFLVFPEDERISYFEFDFNDVDYSAEGNVLSFGCKDLSYLEVEYEDSDQPDRDFDKLYKMLAKALAKEECLIRVCCYTDSPDLLAIACSSLVFGEDRDGEEIEIYTSSSEEQIEVVVGAEPTASSAKWGEEFLKYA